MPPLVRLRLGRSVLVACLAATTAAVSSQPLNSGLDLSAIDRSVRPQDDLYRFANGAWLARTGIPADRVTYGTFAELADRVEHDLRKIIEGLDGRGDEQRIRDLYASMLDEARIEALGAEPIRAELDAIAAIDSPSALARQIGRISTLGDGGPFATSAGVHARDPSALVVTVTQGGTLLPERRYYLSDDADARAIREQYVAYLTRIFTMAGRANPGDTAREVLALETQLAKAQRPSASGEAQAFTLQKAMTELPGFDWNAWARPQGYHHARAILFEQPSFFRSFASAVNETPLETWKAWLSARYITSASIFIAERFAHARFEFFGRVLSGQQAPRERWKRGVSLVNGYLGDALGRLYVKAHFPESSRRRVAAIVRHVVDAARQAVAEAEWLTPATRNRARDKLDRLAVRIGYPDRWRAYDGLVISPDDLLGNVQRARKFENAYQLRRLRRRFEPREWLMTPQTVNAYYTPTRNEIVLPAATLQPPLFDPDAEEAANYGAIGAMVGHEISHAFDARGRLFDGLGRVDDWWTPADDASYQRLAQALVAQYNAYAPVPGARVDGRLTLTENAADLSGLAIALRAYRNSLGGRPAPELDGFTGEQRLLIKWAQVWRERTREEYLRQSVLVIPHAPGEYRANGTAVNTPAFHEAFSVKPGDQLHRDPKNRVRIW